MAGRRVASYPCMFCQHTAETKKTGIKHLITEHWRTVLKLITKELSGK